MWPWSDLAKQSGRVWLKTWLHPLWFNCQTAQLEWKRPYFFLFFCISTGVGGSQWSVQWLSYSHWHSRIIMWIWKEQPLVAARRDSRQANVIVSFRGIFSTFFLIFLLFSLHLRPPRGCISTISLSFIGNSSPNHPLSHFPTNSVAGAPLAHITSTSMRESPSQSLSHTDAQSHMPLFSARSPHSRWTRALSFSPASERGNYNYTLEVTVSGRARNGILLSSKFSAPLLLPSVLQTLLNWARPDKWNWLPLGSASKKKNSKGLYSLYVPHRFTPLLSISCISPPPGC